MEQLWNSIAALDLNSVRRNFDSQKSWWWHLTHTPARVEIEYRQFLYLLISNPDRTVVPWSKDVEEFWDQHTRDRRKYSADARLIAGRPIPFTALSAYTPGQRSRANAATRKMYLAAFGETERRRRAEAGATWAGSEDAQVYSEGRTVHGHHHGHHGGGNHPGHHANSGHSGGHHSCGGHHGCGGHSGCGGHGGH